jgi:hypothetical protein
MAQHRVTKTIAGALKLRIREGQFRPGAPRFTPPGV